MRKNPLIEGCAFGSSRQQWVDLESAPFNGREFYSTHCDLASFIPMKQFVSGSEF
jgi:hypothetical protein